MIAHTGLRFIKRLSACLFTVLLLTGPLSAQDIRGGVVRSILDGDTLVLHAGEKVRLLGLDAPEKGEVFSRESRDRLIELTKGKVVELEACSEKDKYGRILAVVRTGGINVNMLLLEEGLAVPMLIPPCGKIVAEDVLKAAETALEVGRGIYALEEYRVVNHEMAGSLLGKRAVIRGKILALHKGEKAWHFNFGEDWREDFTAVLFSQGLSRFKALGVDPEEMVGRDVLVIGQVKSYNGPEIIVKGPEQMIPVK